MDGDENDRRGEEEDKGQQPEQLETLKDVPESEKNVNVGESAPGEPEAAHIHRVANRA